MKTTAPKRDAALAEALAALFVQVVKLAGECGLVRLGTIAVDGTKLRAKASKHKAMSYERMQAAEVELKAQIQALLARAAQTDVSEADEPELDIPAEIERREQRGVAIQAAKRRLEERQRLADTQSGRKPDTPPPMGRLAHLCNRFSPHPQRRLKRSRNQAAQLVSPRLD